MRFHGKIVEVSWQIFALLEGQLCKASLYRFSEHFVNLNTV